MKDKRKILVFLLVVAFSAILVTIIWDIFLHQKMTFSQITSVSILAVFLILLAVIQANQHRILVGMISFSLLLLPYLYIMEKILKLDFFFSLGLPLGITGIIALWVVYFLGKIRRKLGTLNYLGLLVMFLGVIVTTVVHYVVASYLIEPFISLSLVINLTSSIVIGILLFIVAGLYHKNKKLQKKEAEIDIVSPTKPLESAEKTSIDKA